MKKTNKKGFTIVELVIVIAVIAILAAVLIPTFSGVVARANQSAAQQLALTAVKSSLLMTNTASLPNGTFILINSSKTSTKDPDYGFKYNGNELETNPVNLIDSNTKKFDSSFLNNAKGYSILVNSEYVNTDIAVGSTGLPVGVNMLQSMLQFVNGGIGSSATIDKNAADEVNVVLGDKEYPVFTSPDIPANVIVFVPVD